MAGALDRAETPDLVFVVADGLSALAVQRHAVPVLAALVPALEQAGPGLTGQWRVNEPFRRSRLSTELLNSLDEIPDRRGSPETQEVERGLYK